MQHTHASETAIRVAAMRAAHQIIDADPKILNDPIAIGLIREASESALEVALATHEQRGMRHLRANFALRSRIAEDWLQSAMERGVSQYLILGAGLDTFAYRQPSWAAGIQVVEIDHPASQDFKIDALRRAHIAIPANVNFLPVDLGEESIAAKLSEAPLDPTKPIFVSWLGVTQYLDYASILSTLRVVSSWRGGGEIVLTYITNDWSLLPPDEAEAMRIGDSRAASSGEPWISKFSEQAISEILEAGGFASVEHIRMASIRTRYFYGRSDNLQPSAGIGIVQAASG